jgi:hypothetical protein
MTKHSSVPFLQAFPFLFRLFFFSFSFFVSSNELDRRAISREGEEEKKTTLTRKKRKSLSEIYMLELRPIFLPPFVRFSFVIEID